MKQWSLIIVLVALNICISSSSASSLGHITVVDPMLGSRILVYEKKEGYAVVEDDILIGKLSTFSKKSALILNKIGGGRWPKGLVPFELNEDLPILNKLAVLQAIIYVQEKTNVQFVELTSSNRDLYPDYLSFVPAKGTTCASYVGKQTGQQDIFLSSRCSTMITVHEIGHALGLWHEQSRADRDAYVKIVWENIDEPHRYNFEQHLHDGIDLSDYDYQSIMHYNAYAFSKNGKKTIIPLMPDVQIGQREQLSDKDITAIDAMYPKSMP